MPVGRDQATSAFSTATCIGCGACVASCRNASASLFVAVNWRTWVSRRRATGTGQPRRRHATPDGQGLRQLQQQPRMRRGLPAGDLRGLDQLDAPERRGRAPRSTRSSCSQPGTATDGSIEISKGLLTTPLAQLLKDHISLQSQQKGLTGVSLQVSRPALKLFRPVQSPLAGGGRSALQALSGIPLNSSQPSRLSTVSAAEGQDKRHDCDGSCHHETWRRFAVMMAQLCS